VPDAEALGDRLGRYASVLEGKPLRVLLVADDRLRYEEAARLIGACSSAGVSTVRLADPSDRRGRPRGGP
jgi:biopolymer transport protein ExbD